MDIKERQNEILKLKDLARKKKAAIEAETDPVEVMIMENELLKDLTILEDKIKELQGILEEEAVRRKIEEIVKKMMPRSGEKRYTVEEYIEYYNSQQPYYSCECIIDKNGSILEARIGHQNTLMGLYMEKYGEMTKEEMWSLIPVDADVMNWLTSKTEAISVWPNFTIGEKRTAAQLAVIDKLKDCKLIKETLIRM